jgi:hypothetical protein
MVANGVGADGALGGGEFANRRTGGPEVENALAPFVLFNWNPTVGEADLELGK